MHKLPRIIIGIDPGTYKSAVVIFDTLQWEPVFVQHINNNLLVSSVVEFLNNKYPKETPHVIYERMRLYQIDNGKSGAGDSTFITCAWYGRFIEGFFRDIPGVVISSIDSPTIKLAFLGYTNPPKAKLLVKKAMYELFPATGGGATPAVGVKKQPGPLFIMRSQPAHCYDALAVALVLIREKQGKFTGDFRQESR